MYHQGGFTTMQTSGESLWEKTLQVLENKLGNVVFQTWLAATKVDSLSEDQLVIKVPTEVALDHIQKNLYSDIHNAIHLIENQPIKIKLILSNDANSKSITKGTYNNHTNHDNFIPIAQFNPRYTFETFVIGDRNRLAHAASIAVSERPAQNYNPFFLYGGVGLGKTHLMHAIGQHALEINSRAKIVYNTSETFVNEFVTALQLGTINDFRNKYRKVDILLIDDIQFIAGKEGTQEEFFHTFNALHTEHKQIVITSDRPPKDIQHLEDRLRSRFSGGLIIDIKPPEFETRVAILQKKAKSEGIELPDNVFLYIANKIESNVRELEGALIRVFAYSSMMNKDIDLSLAQAAIVELVPENIAKALTIHDIQRAVCDQFHIKTDDLRSRSRQRDVVYPRQIAMYIARELTGLSLPKIGKEFGGRDHTTVMHAISKMTKEIQKDDQVAKLVNKLKERLSH